MFAVYFRNYICCSSFCMRMFRMTLMDFLPLPGNYCSNTNRSFPVKQN